MASRVEFERAVELMGDGGGETGRTEDVGELRGQLDGESRRAVVLRERDRELLVQLAMARYLSTEQIGELVFSGKSNSIARRRLSLLRRGRYLRRLPLRTTDGKQAIAWGLTSLGYLAARNHFDAIQPPPSRDPSSGLLERQLLLNQLFVSLASAAKSKKVPFSRWPFRWAPSDSARLHWTALDAELKRPVEHALCPDATLELPFAKRRIFIEVEASHHALGLRSQRRKATMSKIERYARFVVGPPAGGETTHYASEFPDRWPAELLFVVPIPAHRDAIAQWAADEWRGADEVLPFNLRVLTLEEARSDLCHLAGLQGSRASVLPAPLDGVTLTEAEFRALYDFYNWTIASIASVRRFAKSHPEITMLQLPQYPTNHERVKSLCLRLVGSYR